MKRVIDRIAPDKALGLKKEICAECGKEFYRRCELSDYVYKRPKGHGKETRYARYCSWTCYRASEKVKPQRKKVLKNVNEA